MEGVRTFLESSTIHGLTYISTTRKYARILWILIVLAGFIGASLLIKESFVSWSESPIQTTIESLPISKIRLPKVTVCPPKNTFTDLNYDLVITGNSTLTEDIRDEMFKYAFQIIEEDSFTLNNWTKLDEKDRFYNWYHGFTKIHPPSFNEYSNNINYYISTSATSGVVTTQYYGEKFQPDLVERSLSNRVYIHPPMSVLNNENVTLHFKLEKVSMTGLTSGSMDEVMIEGVLDDHKRTAYKNFTPPCGEGCDMQDPERTIRLYRDVNSDDLEITELKVMPGFRFSWWYTSKGVDVTPDHKYENYRVQKYIPRFVNIVTNSIMDKKAIWSQVKTIRFEYIKKNMDVACHYRLGYGFFPGFIPEADIIWNMEEL